jgi:hypothetical protein
MVPVRHLLSADGRSSYVNEVFISRFAIAFFTTRRKSDRSLKRFPDKSFPFRCSPSPFFLQAPTLVCFNGATEISAMTYICSGRPSPETFYSRGGGRNDRERTVPGDGGLLLYMTNLVAISDTTILANFFLLIFLIPLSTTNLQFTEQKWRTLLADEISVLTVGLKCNTENTT